MIIHKLNNNYGVSYPINMFQYEFRRFINVQIAIEI
jgi:hypothetical protein